MGLLTDSQNCGLRMGRECRERFPRHRIQWKPLISDPGMHQGTCVTYVPWCMSGSQTSGGGKNVPGIPGACATRNFAYLERGQWHGHTLSFTGPMCGKSSAFQHNGLIIKIFCCFFGVTLNRLLNKQLSSWWNQTPFYHVTSPYRTIYVSNCFKGKK